MYAFSLWAYYKCTSLPWVRDSSPGIASAVFIVVVTGTHLYFSDRQQGGDDEGSGHRTSTTTTFRIDRPPHDSCVANAVSYTSWYLGPPVFRFYNRRQLDRPRTTISNSPLFYLGHNNCGTTVVIIDRVGPKPWTPADRSVSRNSATWQFLPVGSPNRARW